jgi:hypothetical protein
MAELTVADREERLRLALEATWEVDAVTALILKELPDVTECAPLRVLARRIDELNSVIMSVTGGEDGRDTAEMKKVVHA